MDATPSTVIVWFQLVDTQGNNFRRSNAAFAFLPPPHIVANLCDAVKAKCSRKLADFDADDLVVYANKAALTANEPPLEPFVPLDGMGAEHASALVVVVPQTFAVQQPAPSELPHRGTYFLYF
jgi:hypothetical protein